MDSQLRYKIANTIFAVHIFPMSLCISSIHEYVGVLYFGFALVIGMIHPRWFSKILSFVSGSKIKPRLSNRMVKALKKHKADNEIGVDKVRSLIGTAYVLTHSWNTYMSLLENGIIEKDTPTSYLREDEAIAKAREYRYALLKNIRKTKKTYERVDV